MKSIKTKIPKAELDAIKHETASMRKLNSEYVVRLFDDFQSETRITVIMERLACDLSQYFGTVAKQILPELHFRFFAQCIARGLLAMHEKELVHRDLKTAKFVIVLVLRVV